jgi:hypothetical protein
MEYALSAAPRVQTCLLYRSYVHRDSLAVLLPLPHPGSTTIIKMSDSSFDDGVSSLTSLAPSVEPTERPKRKQPGRQTQVEGVAPGRERTAAGESPEPAMPDANTAKRKREKTSWVWKHGEERTIDGADWWVCNLCPNRSTPKRYKVSSGTRAPASHLKEKHGKEEEINRKVQRLEERKNHIAAAFENAERLKKVKGLLANSPGASSNQTGHSLWNPDTHKALLVRLVADQDLTFAFPTAASFQGYAEFLKPEAACYGGYYQRPCHFSRLQVRLRGARGIE